MNVSNRAIFLALAVWGVCVCGAFWQYEWRYLRPAGRPLGAAAYRLNGDKQPLPRTPLGALDTDQGGIDLAGSTSITLLNFWSPTCACSRFAESQVRALAEDYRRCKVRFITVVECGAAKGEQATALAAWRERGMPKMPVATDPGGGIARAFGVWAAPGAVILNRQGRIAYIGSYNAGRFCADPSTAWAQQALQTILTNHNPSHASMPFYGCQVADWEKGRGKREQ
jgi:hypothetical protein